jgi:hypothetical protein
MPMQCRVLKKPSRKAEVRVMGSDIVRSNEK